MYIPFLSPPRYLPKSDRHPFEGPRLARRRGSSGGKGGKGGSSSSSSSSSGSSTRGGSSVSTSSLGKGSTASSTTLGGGTPRTIPAGSPFAGRTYGGSARGAIWGTRTYGSGYAAAAGVAAGSVAGRNFGYGFWPVYWGPRYYNDDEYGPGDNSSRPGGPQVLASFSAPSYLNGTLPVPLPATSPPQYAIYADNASVAVVFPLLASNCSAVLVANATTPPGAVSNLTLYPNVTDGDSYQYYRESSFAWASFVQGETEDDGVPVGGVFNGSTFYWDQLTKNATFEACVNDTIANNLPIVAAARALAPHAAGLASTVLLLWTVLGSL